MNKLYSKLFNFTLSKNLKISITDNELYNQFLLYVFYSLKHDLLILVPKINDATNLFKNLKNNISETYLFPEDDYLTKKALASSEELKLMRLNFLNSISSDKNKIVICNVNSFIKKLPSQKMYKGHILKLKLEQSIDRSELLQKLADIGYNKDSLVENIGEYAVRGFVIDIFPVGEEHPIRLYFNDDKIEKIFYFDELNQRLISKIDSIEINPMKDEIGKMDSNILDYLDSPFLIYQDKNQCESVMDSILKQIEYFDKNYDYIFNLNQIIPDNKIYVDLINKSDKYDYVFESKNIENFNNNYNSFIQLLKNKNTFLCTKNKNFIKKIKKLLPNFNILDENISSGFIYKGNNYLCENDLIKNQMTNVYQTYKFGKKIKDLEKLNIGDYVVHRKYGIGIYEGIKTITKNNISKDYILIQYKGNDKLYLSIENIDKLYRYSSKEGSRPKINQLNSKEWQTTKLKIKSKIKDITERLLKIYKKRANVKINPFLKDDPLQLVFENSFPYEFTVDQEKSTQEIKKDMESGIPMDRLLCGDAGYGKTEVIFRAIFKTVLNGKQAIYLCPTTLLSNQQYNSAINRFNEFGVKSSLLNRFTTNSELLKIKKGLKDGSIDVIFGTHRLLTGDLEFKNLGLLVIDEEHRFGVMQKEKIKQLKSDIHVLGVSATPIPRSLQMSLIGIRDLSLIETPPKNRLPVQTYVLEFDFYILREVILKEFYRNGQIFMIYNDIYNMEDMYSRLQKLIPEIKICYAHGKMSKEEINEVMYKFINKEYDLLLSTTIIENGIDIPNANTMIVLNSDLFGLSQLYQIRGRVGRGDRIAYAYLFYDKRKILTETAVKRLNTIKEFTELGSGYKIAIRDLSIRGAGDILGSEQAGFIDSVGVDMYLQLVNEEVNNIQDEEDSENEILLDDVSTHIGNKISDEEEILIELHKKISSIKTLKELKALKSEIEDRFGYIDEQIEVYMYQKLLEKMLNSNNIKININSKEKISLKIDEKTYNKLSIEKLFIKAYDINPKFKFIYRGKNIFIELYKKNLEKHYIYYLIDLILYINKNL